MRRPRSNYYCVSDAKIALKEVYGGQALAELIHRFKIYAIMQTAAWKAKLLKGSADAFEDRKPTAGKG